MRVVHVQCKCVKQALLGVCTFGNMTKAGFAPKAARAIKKSSVWRHRAYVFCRQRFVCSHRARYDLLRIVLTCVEIHVHFVMYTSAYMYIDYLVIIIKYRSLNNIFQWLLHTVHIPMHDNVTMDEVEVKNMEIAIENVARRRRDGDGYATNNFSKMRRRDRRRCF